MKPKRTDRGNLFLRALPGDSRARLSPHLEHIDLARGHILCEAGAVLKHFYFPHTCALSLIAIGSGGESVETVIIGREGLYGAPTALTGQESLTRSIVQLGGSADRLPVAHFRKEFDRSDKVRNLVLRYHAAALAQIQQTVLCNAFHPAEARLCLYLLMMLDRAATNDLPLTQEFLATILGANRSTVTIAARTLQAAKLIKYRRGSIVVLDRDGLEEAVCECYGIVRRHFQRLMPIS